MSNPIDPVWLAAATSTIKNGVDTEIYLLRALAVYAYLNPAGGSAYNGPLAAQLPPALGPQATNATALGVTQATGDIWNVQFTGEAGTATAALQVTGNTSLASILAALPASLGPKTGAASLSIVQASDANIAKETGGNLASILTALQAATPAGANIIGKVTIDQTTPGTTNAVVITGTVPLPSLAATSTIQTTQQTSLTAIAAVEGTTGDTAYADGTGAAAGTIEAIDKGLFVQGAAAATATGTTASAAYTDGTGAAAGGVIALLKGAYIKLAAIATSVAGTLGINLTQIAGTNVGVNNPLYSVPGSFDVNVSITRPANTTAYASGQLIATTSATALPTLDLSGVVGANARRVRIVEAIITSSNGGAGTQLTAQVVVFNSATPAGVTLTDQAAFAPTVAIWLLAQALMDSLATTFKIGASSYGLMQTEVARTATTDASGHLYPAIIATNAYTPASGETINLRVRGLVQ